MARPTNTQFAVAVHVLTLLSAGPGARMSSNEMADSVGSNAVYLRRVLGQLRGAGLVRSRPGVGGGWQACRLPEDISLGDVWRAIHAGDAILGLHETSPNCPVGRRIQLELSALDRRAARALEAELDCTTIRDVVPDDVSAAPAVPAA
jgi:Rrf2 family protein